MIEIIVVFTVIAIISAVGVASFVNYSRTQTVNTAVSDVANILNKARSRAASQIRPQVSGCDNNESLDGYRVAICATDIASCASNNQVNYYQLQAKCGGVGQYRRVEEKRLPSSVEFDSSSYGKTFFFPVLTGGSSNEDSIMIKGYGITKTINVYKDGRITMIAPTPTLISTPTPTSAVHVPVPESVNPSSWTSNILVQKYFTTTFSDSDTSGYSHMTNVYFLVSVDGGAINNFYAYYSRPNNKLYLRNANNTGWLGGQIPTSAGSVDNGYFKLYFNNTNTTNTGGNNLVINWYIEPLADAGGKTYTLYIRAQDSTGSDSFWKQKGTWTVN